MSITEARDELSKIVEEILNDEEIVHQFYKAVESGVYRDIGDVFSTFFHDTTDKIVKQKCE